MADEGSGKDDPEAGRFRLLRRAEGYESGTAWADYLGWGQSAVSMYETGQRRVPRDAALELLEKVPGFDPVWLWTGDKRNLAFDLRKRIEAIEGTEDATKSGSNEVRVARNVQQDVPIRKYDPESNEAVARRLKLLRHVVSAGNKSQKAFVARLGIEQPRWSNFENNSSLSKEVAFLIVEKFPDFTLDWLWRGDTRGMSFVLQRELEEVEKTLTTSSSDDA